jgi:hypothetical protein
MAGLHPREERCQQSIHSNGFWGSFSKIYVWKLRRLPEKDHLVLPMIYSYSKCVLTNYVLEVIVLTSDGGGVCETSLEGLSLGK